MLHRKNIGILIQREDALELPKESFNEVRPHAWIPPKANSMDKQYLLCIGITHKLLKAFAKIPVKTQDFLTVFPEPYKRTLTPNTIMSISQKLTQVFFGRVIWLYR